MVENEKRHYINEKQISYDRERQNYIQNKLGCIFIRVNEKFIDLINKKGGD